VLSLDLVMPGPVDMARRMAAGFMLGMGLWLGLGRCLGLGLSRDDAGYGNDQCSEKNRGYTMLGPAATGRIL